MSICLDLRASYTEPKSYEHAIDSSMFQNIDNPIVKGGQLVAKYTATKVPVGLELNFYIKGVAIVECDYCLDDMQIDIDLNESLKIEFSDHDEDDDDIVYVSKDKTEIDLWPFIYDFIALAIPLTHTHKEGECNQEMLNTLKRYMVSTIDDEN